MDTTHTIILF